MAENPIILAGLAPHAPILIPGIGGRRLEEARHTADSMAILASRVMDALPDSVVVVSPHSPRHAGAFGLWRSSWLRGSFEHFAAVPESVELPLDEQLTDAIELEARRQGLRMWSINETELDHGATVPLWYLAAAGWRGPTVVISLAYPGDKGLDHLGRSITTAARRLHRRIAIIASGDMSHRLTPSSPCGFDPQGREFDRAFVHLLREGSYDRITHLDPAMQDNAAEDVVESTLVAAAATGGHSDGHEVLSYEGPFGVGYCVAVLYAQSPSHDSAGKTAVGAQQRQAANLSRCEQLPALARRAILEHLQKSRELPRLVVSGEVAGPGCVFVTLYDGNGELRGCIGTLHPCEVNLARETWRNAVSAAFNDSRFPPLEASELEDLQISVTVLGAMEELRGLEDLDPKTYGVVISTQDGRRGVLLPDIDGVDTVERQLQIARSKAGIGSDEAVEIRRFRVRCFEENQDQAWIFP